MRIGYPNIQWPMKIASPSTTWELLNDLYDATTESRGVCRCPQHFRSLGSQRHGGIGRSSATSLGAGPRDRGGHDIDPLVLTSWRLQTSFFLVQSSIHIYTDKPEISTLAKFSCGVFSLPRVVFFFGPTAHGFTMVKHHPEGMGMGPGFVVH